MRTLKYRAYIKPLKRYAEKYETILYHHQCNMEPSWTVDISPEEYYGDEDLVIEQFTRLLDRNGKEIYEGDIVNIVAIVETNDSDMACIMDTNSIVCWDKEYARWDVNDEPEDKDWDYRRRRYFVFVDNKDRENVEVVGNIHENGELLGGGE